MLSALLRTERNISAPHQRDRDHDDQPGPTISHPDPEDRRLAGELVPPLRE